MKSDWGFIAKVIHVHHRHGRRENGIFGKGLVVPIDMDQIADRGIADAGASDFEPEDGSLFHAMSEFYFVHADGDKAVLGVFEGRRHPSDFIYPFQHVTAEKHAIVIQVFGHDQFVSFHGNRLVGGGRGREGAAGQPQTRPKRTFWPVLPGLGGR